MFTNKSHPRHQRNQEASKSGENQIFLPHPKKHKEPAVHFHLAAVQTQDLCTQDPISNPWACRFSNSQYPAIAAGEIKSQTRQWVLFLFIYSV